MLLFVYMSAKQCWSKAALLYKLGISTLWMFVLPGMHPDYCYMLSGSCTPPPCSCSLLGSYMRLLESCPLPQMPDSVYTSPVRGDQSYVPLATYQTSSADQRPPLNARHLHLCGCLFCPGCTRTTAICCRAPARCRRAPARCCRAPACYRQC